MHGYRRKRQDASPVQCRRIEAFVTVWTSPSTPLAKANCTCAPPGTRSPTGSSPLFDRVPHEDPPCIRWAWSTLFAWAATLPGALLCTPVRGNQFRSNRTPQRPLETHLSPQIDQKSCLMRGQCRNRDYFSASFAKERPQPSGIDRPRPPTDRNHHLDEAPTTGT